MYLSVKHFKHFLEGRKFVIYTDHKPLTFALASSTDRSPHQTRHLSYVAEFTSDVRHVKGSKNVVADPLSRPSCSEVRLPTIDFQRMAAAQDPLDARDTSLEVKSVLWQGSLLLCDVSQGHPRPLVPSSFRRQVFEALHQLSHPGPRPCTKLVAARFVWPGMRRDIKSWCRQCPSCQSSKITRHVKAPVVVFPPASRRFGSPPHRPCWTSSAFRELPLSPNHRGSFFAVAGSPAAERYFGFCLRHSFHPPLGFSVRSPG